MSQREARAKPLDLPRSFRCLLLGPAASARPRHLNAMATQVPGLSKRASPLHVDISSLPFRRLTSCFHHSGSSLDALHGVASIDDEIGGVGEFREIEGGVVGGDDDAVLSGQGFL